MKKTLLASLLLAGISSALFAAPIGYPITITNKSQEQIKVNVKFAACQEKNWWFNAGETRTVYNGLCCAEPNVDITGVRTSRVTRFQPPRTGYGISCRGWNMVVKQAQDGSLVAEEA